MKPLIAEAAVALAMLEPAGAAESELKLTRAGTRPADAAPVQNFTGAVKTEMLYTPERSERASAGTVNFDPGARTAWHSHLLGQTLVATAGVGRVQRWGGPVEQIRVGDVVHIPANVKHWHGAVADSAMTHVAITEVLDGKPAEWMEPVSDAQYGAPPAAPSLSPSQGQPRFGDIAPKFAQPSEELLVGDVWARPGQWPRDRVAAA